MDVELLYLYIGDNNTPVKNIDICFSHEYKIKYINAKKTLEIEKMEDYQYKDFYGKYIRGCSLIVGENGSGKTTLLNFLGLLSDNLNMYYNLKEKRNNKLFSSNKKFNCNEFGCWFALYFIDNKFYIEGYNYERLFGKNRLNDMPISMNFSMFIDYDFELNIMLPIMFSNHQLTTPVDFYYYKKLPESIISNFEIQQSNGNMYHEDKPNQDYTIRLNRREILSANVNNIYKLFEDYNNLLFEENFGKNSNIIFEINEIDYEYSNQYVQKLESELGVFGNEKIESLKEAFISNLYYSLAFGLWNAYFRNYDFKKIGIAKAINLPLTKSYEMDREIAIYYLEHIREEYDKTIPNYVGILDEFVNLIKPLDKDFFIKGSLIKVPLIKHNVLVQNLLDYYCGLSEEESLEQIVKLKYTNLSSGEQEYIEGFGSIIKILSEITPNSKCTSRVLLLDEPDRTFHPQWTSNYIFKLMKILNRFGENNNISFQLIITTHSPFMVSDVLKEDIYKIEDIDKNRIITNSDSGFASNYYDIMKDSFFLTDSVGEFAKEKIEYINNQINGAKNISELSRLEKYINVIGDDYLKTILEVNYRKKINEISSVESKDVIKDKILKKEEELRFLKELYKKYE